MCSVRFSPENSYGISQWGPECQILFKTKIDGACPLVVFILLLSNSSLIGLNCLNVRFVEYVKVIKVLQLQSSPWKKHRRHGRLIHDCLNRAR